MGAARPIVDPPAGGLAAASRERGVVISLPKAAPKGVPDRAPRISPAIRPSRSGVKAQKSGAVAPTIEPLAALKAP
jgi:hypothetical protein